MPIITTPLPARGNCTALARSRSNTASAARNARWAICPPFPSAAQSSLSATDPLRQPDRNRAFPACIPPSIAANSSRPSHQTSQNHRRKATSRQTLAGTTAAAKAATAAAGEPTAAARAIGGIARKRRLHCLDRFRYRSVQHRAKIGHGGIRIVS